MSEIETVAAGEREALYRFLSSLYLRPLSDSLIAMIKDKSILSFFQDGDKGREEGGSWFSGLSEFVEQAQTMANLNDELEAEHASLFMLPSGVIPHEAVYLDKEKRLGGGITMSVRRFYERAGADILENCIDLPDHLGMELEFMGFLCKLEKELRKGADAPALQKCVAFQKKFIDEHISKWAYKCCEEIVAYATYGFYKAIARYTMEFLKSEEEYVSEGYVKVCGEGESICETVKT